MLDNGTSTAVPASGEVVVTGNGEHTITVTAPGGATDTQMFAISTAETTTSLALGQPVGCRPERHLHRHRLSSDHWRRNAERPCRVPRRSDADLLLWLCQRGTYRCRRLCTVHRHLQLGLDLASYDLGPVPG